MRQRPDKPLLPRLLGGIVHFAGGMRADGFEDILNGNVAPIQSSRSNRTP